MNEIERQRILHWFESNRKHTEALFASIRPEAYYVRPIPLRQPIVFYEGHFAAFNYITLVRRALGRTPFAPELDELFERGIDPDTVEEAEAADADWPTRDQVLRYVAETDEHVRRALQHDTPHRRVRILFWPVPRPSTPFSSTRRCIMRHCVTCSIASLMR